MAKGKISFKFEVEGFVPELRHNIEAEVEVDWRNGVGVVEGPLPQANLRDEYGTRNFVGTGPNLLAAVLAWLQEVDRSMHYLPAYDKQEGRKEECGKVTPS